MKQKLFTLYNRCKQDFIDEIIDILKMNKKEDISFNPYIRVSLPRDNDEDFEDITALHYDKDEDTWYVHNFVTDLDLMTSEYWTPLKDMSFDELFKIAERL